jgi:WhiB family transcriptional regulator, redox-sensing transcriptional regulator
MSEHLTPMSGRRWTEEPDLPSVAFSRPLWQSRGNCAGMDPEAFFPERGNPQGIAAALAVCQGCAVTAECLAYALENNETAGVWGATTARQRKQMFGRSRPVRHGTRWSYRLGCRCAECREANADYMRQRQMRRTAS